MEEYKAGLSAAQPDQAPLKAVLHCNLAAALHAMGRHTEAIAECCAAMALDPTYLKAYQRRAEAASALGDINSAVQVHAVPSCLGILMGAIITMVSYGGQWWSCKQCSYAVSACDLQ